VPTRSIYAAHRLSSRRACSRNRKVEVFFVAGVEQTMGKGRGEEESKETRKQQLTKVQFPFFSIFLVIISSFCTPLVVI
jgi:hypothetical protein